MKNSFFLFLFLLVFSRVSLAACDLDDSKAQMMIARLKLEVVCASSHSLDMCRDLIDQFGLNDKNQISLISKDASLCDSTSKQSPLTLPALSVTNHLAAVLRKTPESAGGVTSVEDFFEYTQKHRARVKALGLELYRSQP